MDPKDWLEADALRSFAVFAEHRNFTSAATALNISQPSLHAKIRKLAAALGTDLYRRNGRGLSLTSAGEQLAVFAADASARTDEFLVRLTGASITAPLAVAAGRGTFRWVIPEAIRAICHQGCRVKVMTANRDAAVTALGTGQADMAVIGYDPPPVRFDSRHLASFPQVLVVADDHPLADRRQVAIGDLSGLSLVVPPPGRPHRRALERALTDAGAIWQVAAEADGWDLLVHFAGLGIGATIVNGCVALPTGLTAIPVTSLPAISYWAAWRPERHDRVARLLDLL